MSNGDRIDVTPAKGRPMLTWVGKRPLSYVTAFPAQHVETYAPAGESSPADEGLWTDWPAAYPRGGLLFHGDNKEVLGHLLANGFRGKVKMVYIDPPFDSGADYVRKVALRGAAPGRLDGEAYTLGEQVQYTDIWANDNYLQFMYERLTLLRELLSEDGSIFVHCDDARNYVLRAVLEELFPGCFRNEIIWKRTTSTGLAQKRCGTLHDTIYWYSRGDQYVFNMQYHAYEEDYLKRAVLDSDGRAYIPIPTGNPGYRPNLYYEYKGYLPHPNGYKWTRDKMEEFDRQGRLVFPENKSGRIQYKQYLDEMEGVKLQDIWTDIPAVNPVALERTAYPTQKPEALLDRIVQMASNPGDLVLDCFIGSGTTAAVAQKSGRRWIGCDINKGAIQTTAKRLQTIIQEHVAEREGRQAKLVDMEGEDQPPEPAQQSFTVWRVNDYDLQIQHNEAVNLACEHLGVQRSRADAFFDGTLGRSLVKIVPFHHPLSPLDLEEIRRELDARREDDRAITVVCLGKELAADAWIQEWNRLRRGDGAANRIDVIELRSDPRFGRFIAHRPAQVRVAVERQDGEIRVAIEDFISPTIVERLRQHTGALEPQIDDWRAMVDSVMIDPAHDGTVFAVALSDVPEKKDDLVQGAYTLPAPAGPTTVAVKITDMLGEEVLVTREV